jgi:DNA-binding NarL/FixJ family response regulator
MPVFLVQDDLFFAARVEAVARRLGAPVVAIALGSVEGMHFEPGSVVVVQVTLHPERQLQLVERLRQKDPPPTVVAVAGHLETGLRRRARALGAMVASHSGMERTIARALSSSSGPSGPSVLPRAGS